MKPKQLAIFQGLIQEKKRTRLRPAQSASDLPSPNVSLDRYLARVETQ